MEPEDAERTFVDRQQQGDHVCWIFDGEDEYRRAVARYVQAGLDVGHKILCITHTLTPAALVAGLDELGVPARTGLTTGQVRVATSAETYLAGGKFDMGAMLDIWRQEIATARSQGWAGLRGMGEMSWAVGPVTGARQLATYEAQLNPLYVDGYAMVLCLYDRRRFPAAELDRVASAHPATVDQQVPQPAGGWTPMLRMRRLGDPPGLRLSGQADMSNRHALSTVMSDLFEQIADTAGPVVIDLSGLTFADASATHLLTLAALGAPEQVRLVGSSPQLAQLLNLVSDYSLPPLVLEQPA